MSLIGNISILNAALRNFQAGTNVTANNMANALTTGYSRQRLELEPIAPYFDGTINQGYGARQVTVSRLRNIFLDTQIRTQLAELNRASARNLALQELAAIFPEIASPTATSGLQGAMDDLTAKWTALAAAPGSTAAKTAVRDSLEALADRLNVDARMVYDLQVKLDHQVESGISELNNLLTRVAELNKQIVVAKAGAGGQDPNTLLDIRGQVAEKIVALAGGSVRENSDGSMSVVVGGAQVVDHGQVWYLKAIPSRDDPGRTAIGYFVNPANQYIDITRKVTGGKLGGLLEVRDTDAQEARLALDKIAYGYIQRSNEINRTAIAPDLTSNHAIFTGTKASDIALDTTLRTNVSYIGATRDTAAPGDVATLMAALDKIYMYSSVQSSPLQNIQNPVGAFIDPTTPIGGQIPLFAATPGNPPAGNPGQFIISSGGNSVTINWLGTDSINDIIRNINTAGGGSIYATYDQTSRKMFVYSQGPLTVYDTNFSFARAMKLSAVVTSSAPINNSALSSLNQASGVVGMNASPNSINLFTNTSPQSTVPYRVKVDASTITWFPSDDIPTVLANITAANTIATGRRISSSFNPNTQIVSLVHVGDTLFNTGTLSAANPMTSVQVSDLTGNLTRVFNFDTTGNASSIHDEIVTALGSRKDVEGLAEAQAQALVDNTQALQDAHSKVDWNEELAQAKLYARAYEASVRLQAIVDEMLNVLINHMGSAGTSSSSSV